MRKWHVARRFCRIRENIDRKNAVSWHVSKRRTRTTVTVMLRPIAKRGHESDGIWHEKTINICVIGKKNSRYFCILHEKNIILHTFRSEGLVKVPHSLL